MGGGQGYGGGGGGEGGKVLSPAGGLGGSTGGPADSFCCLGGRTACTGAGSHVAGSARYDQQ